MKRKIAAILSADVAGYSRLVAEDEEEALRRLTAYQGVFKEHIASAGGRIFNTAGDAVLAEFPSAVDAMRAAMEIQESLRTRNRAYPSSRQMAFRMGLTIGDVVEQEGGDLLGDGVNIAARLQTLAKPGGICISKSMHDSVANKLSVKFVDIGAHQLKNIPSPVNAFSAVLDDSTEKTDTSSDENDGARRPRSFSLPMAAVAAMLIGGGVAAVTTGYFDKPTDEVKTADTDTKAKTEAKVATGPAAGLPVPPDVNTTAAEPIAEPEPEPAAVEPAKPADPPPSTPAVEAKSAEPEPAPKPETKVATLPPDRADDLAAMARLRPIRWSECKGENTEVALAACRALVADSGTSGKDLALAHRQLAYALRKKGDTEGAINAFTKSIEVVESTEAYNDRGIAYLLAGKSNKAIADYDSAINLDANNGDAYNNRAWTYFKMGKLNEALSDADRAVRMIADKAYAWDTRGHIHEALGNRRNAIQDFEKALSLDSKMDSSETALKRLRGS